MRARSLWLLLLMPVVLAGVPAVARTTGSCQVDHTNPAGSTNLAPHTQDIPAFHGLKGHYALPKTHKPKTLVVMFHGYGNISDSWVCHLLDAAQKHGAVAVAMDYRGTGWTGPATDNRGWFVREGAADSIFAAGYFLKRFPSIRNVEAFGISMGGNASGLAVAAGAKRPGTHTPLFDYWVDVEGATSMIETYAEATAVGASGNAVAVHAKEDIEKECGGTPADAPTCYQDLTVLLRTPDIASSGLKGVIAVHGIDDGLVPHNQSEEMTTALRAAGIPTDYYIALRRNDWQNPATADPEGGTVLSSDVFGPVFGAAGQTYPAPLAGHGWEGSNTQLVIATGFARLWALVDHGAAPANHEYLVDSDLGTHQVF
ncbi:MAG: alpha/beta hydrolase family protein [Actinomycetota bacterium]